MRAFNVDAFCVTPRMFFHKKHSSDFSPSSNRIFAVDKPSSLQRCSCVFMFRRNADLVKVFRGFCWNFLSFQFHQNTFNRYFYCFINQNFIVLFLRVRSNPSFTAACENGWATKRRTLNFWLFQFSSRPKL